MLHPKHNRIDYGEQLIPPNGYEFVQAIGTTYSLDLEALMVLPVALFYAQTLDGNPDEMRYDMLDAITKAADKITVYYQNGQLKVPQKYHHLMAYWEKGIEKVTMPDHVSSFHPKVWIMRYENGEKPPIYRVLITSRNLTFARDWDVAFSTEGIVTDKEQPINKPLINFLDFLSISGKKKIGSSFLQDLLKVKFDLPERFDTLSFLPIGIQNPNTGKKYPNPLTASKAIWDEMLIISPFVDKTTLDTLSRCTHKPPYLLSRKEELDAVQEETLKAFHTWQFSKFIQEAEYFEELAEEGILPSEQNLHAKLFVAMTGKISNWYLGSANCSDPAQGRNIEFMVELKSENTSALKTKDVFNVLTNPDKADGISLFTPYNFAARISVEEYKKIDLDIRRIKYDLSKLTLKGKCNIIEGGTSYNLEIEIDAVNFSLPVDYKVKFKPLSEQQKATIALKPNEINTIKDFTGYSETALTPFLEFEIWKKSERYSHFLLAMEIELPESRLNKIFTSIINSREKFLKYLTFLLTGEDTEVIGTESIADKRNTQPNDESWAFTGTPVYEKLLIAASRYPNKLKSIDALILRLKSESSDLDEPIITAEFESFWHVFQTFMLNKK